MLLQKKLAAIIAVCIVAGCWSPRAVAVFDNPCLIVNIASRDNPLEADWLNNSLFFLSAKMRSSRLLQLNYEDAVQADDNIPGMEEEEAQSVFDIQGEIRFLPPEESSTFNPSE
ncbi:MAG: hypothetical protein AAGF10_00040 [Verrucomicrobiota bacterium]